MSELTPITRVESYLDAIVNSGIPPTEDITRIETFLQAIYDNQVCALTPITRIEMFLGKISGQDIVLPEPITRIELYLAAIAGEDVELPENPITRLEMYLAEWADSGDWTTISGAIVEFITQRAHKLKSCVVSLSPKQDLHGQDAPYPAGGGKQLLDPSTFDIITTTAGVTATLNSDGTISLSGTATATDYIRIIGYKLLSDYGIFTADTTYKLSGYANSNCYVGFGIKGSGTDYWASTAAGKDMSFTAEQLATKEYRLIILVNNGTNTNGITIKPMICLASASNPTTFAPYENICPISGWSGCEVTRTGKNLVNEPSVFSGGVKQSDGMYFFSNVNSGIDVFVNNGYTGQFAVTELYRGAAADSVGYVIRIYYTDGTSEYAIPSASTTQVSVTKITNASKVVQKVRVVPQTALASYINVQIELGSTATAYEPYNGNSYSVTWEDEVFGGNATYNGDGTWTVTADFYRYVYDGTEEFAKSGTALNGFYNNLVRPATTPAKFPVMYNYGSAIIPITAEISSMFKITLDVNEYKTNYGFCFLDSGMNFDCDPAIFGSTIESFKAKLAELYSAGTPVSVVAKMATPITTTITTGELINALKGHNVVWSNAGNVTVTFRGTPIVEPDAEPLQALNLLLGGAYRNDQTPEDVPDDEALDILLGGADR